MALTLNDVRGIADYARIALTQEELEEMTTYLNETVADVLDPICQYRLDGVVPVFHPIGDLSNVMREDVPADGLTLEVALNNAGQREGRCFRVPSILGTSAGGEQ